MKAFNPVDDCYLIKLFELQKWQCSNNVDGNDDRKRAQNDVERILFCWKENCIHSKLKSKFNINQNSSIRIALIAKHIKAF